MCAEEALVASCNGEGKYYPIPPYASEPLSTRYKPTTRGRDRGEQCAGALCPVISHAIDAVETSDQEERRLLTRESRRDYWFYAGLLPRSTSSSPRSSVAPVALAPMSAIAVIDPIESSGNESSRSETSFPERILRPRKQIQLQPYTVENASYRATLKLRGQKDAIVRLKDIKSGHHFDEYNVDESRRRDTFLAADNVYDGDHENEQGHAHPKPRPLLRTEGQITVFGSIPKWRQMKRGRHPDTDASVEDAGDARYLSGSSSPFGSTAKLIRSSLGGAQPISTPLLQRVSPKHDSQYVSPSPHSSFNKECESARRVESQRTHMSRRMGLQAVTKHHQGRQIRRSQVPRHRGNSRRKYVPSGGVGYGAAARRVGTIRRTTNLQRDSTNAIGNPDFDSDINDASSPDSDAVPLNTSSNDHLYTARSLQGTNQNRNPRLLSSSLSALSQDGSLVDRMLAGSRTRVFPRSRRDRNSDGPRTSVAVCRVAKQGGLKEDLADSSVRVEGPYSRFKVDIAPARHADRTPRNRRDRATHICILEHTGNYWKEVNRGVKPVSAGPAPCSSFPSKAPENRMLKPENRPRANDFGDCQDLIAALTKPSHKNIQGGERPGSRIMLDLSIPVLDPTIHRLHSAYICQGTRLVQLLREEARDDVDHPWLNNYLEVDLQSCKNVQQFETLLPAAFRQLRKWSVGEINCKPEDGVELIASLGRLLSWLSRGHPEDVYHLGQMVQRDVEDLLSTISRQPPCKSDLSSEVGQRYLWLYWVAVELSFRLWIAGANTNMEVVNELDGCIDRLLDALLETSFPGIEKHLTGADNDRPIRSDLIDIWICVIHLLQHKSLASRDGLWLRVTRIFADTARWLPTSTLERSELMWMAAFAITAVSQFTSLGAAAEHPALDAHWPLISLAVSSIHLGAEGDDQRDYRIRRKRDLFIRGLLARCLLLSTRWTWKLTTSAELLNELCEIFRSRQFSGLQGEPPDFPLFLADSKGYAHIHRFDTRDSGFDIFLKLIVRAVQDLRAYATPEVASRQTKKLLSIALPVASAQFSPSKPPTGQELSRLYNRYSAVLVAARLDEPSVTAFRMRVLQARRYSDFQHADWKSRHANIRALMYFAITAIEKGQPLEEVISWLTSIHSQLLVETQGLEAQCTSIHPRLDTRNVQVILCIQFVIGSVRSIFEEMVTMEPADNWPYPDARLLQAGWLSRILQMNCIDWFRDGHEIRRLIQAFLSAALPVRRSYAAIATDDSQDWEDFDIDVNDPLVLALVDGRQSPSKECDTSDKETAEAIQILSSTIYDLINKCFSSEDKMEGDEFAALDEWVECWAGCAHVLVQHNLKDWSHYLELGKESWARIINPVGRRRVGLRFMLTILRLNPGAYLGHEDVFLRLWLQSIVTARCTTEHEFTGELFWADKLRHPLLRDIPCGEHGHHDRYNFSVASFIALRGQIIRGIIGNLAYNGTAGGSEHELGRSYIRTMIEHMVQEDLSLVQDVPARAHYREFCCELLADMRTFHIVEEWELESLTCRFGKLG